MQHRKWHIGSAGCDRKQTSGDPWAATGWVTYIKVPSANVRTAWNFVVQLL